MPKPSVAGIRVLVAELHSPADPSAAVMRRKAPRQHPGNGCCGALVPAPSLTMVSWCLAKVAAARTALSSASASPTNRQNTRSHCEHSARVRFRQPCWPPLTCGPPPSSRLASNAVLLSSLTRFLRAHSSSQMPKCSARLAAETDVSSATR